MSAQNERRLPEFVPGGHHRCRPGRHRRRDTAGPVRRRDAWCWTAMRPSTRCRGRCTPTTRSYRILARLGIGDEFAAHSRPALGLRLIDPQMRVLSRNPAQHRAQRRPRVPADEHVRPARAGSDAARQRQALPHRSPSTATWRSPRVTQNQQRPGAGELPGPGARRRAECAGQLCAGLRRRQQPDPRGHRGAHVRAAVHPGLAGHRRQHRRRSQPVGGLPPAVQPRAWRHVHAGVRNPLPLGIPAGRRRDRSRLPDPGRRRAADQALAGRHSRRRVGAGAGDRLHLPRAGGQPLARPQRVPPR